MISVIIAVGKGDKHIGQQILSILPQLSFSDEVIVSDDRPGGITERIVKKIAAEDSRVIWVEGKGKGNTANFVNAIRHSKGDKIFFCEGRDVWLPDKVKRVMSSFSEGADLVVHNAYVTDENLNITDYSFFEKYSVRKNPVANIIKNSFNLSCMAIDRKILKKVMPIPKSVPAIGQWIGIIAAVYGKVLLVDIPVMYCRADKKEAFESSFRSTEKRILLRKLYKRIFSGN